jgi:hypothetical protein
LPALALGCGSEDIKSALEPIVESVGNFDGLMLGVIGGIYTIYDRLRAIDREVAMEFNHGVSGIDQVGSVRLDFVIVSSAGCCQDHRQCN